MLYGWIRCSCVPVSKVTSARSPVLYDTLLDDFEDDLKTRTSEEEEGLKLPVAEVDDEIDATNQTASDDQKAASEEDDDFLMSADDNESWSDDPVRTI